MIPNMHESNDPGAAPGRPADRRASDRAAVRAPVEFLNMGDDPRVPFYEDFVHGQAEDVSPGGLRVRVAYDVQEGAELGLILRKNDKFQVFLARVVWKMRDSASCLYGLSVPRLEPAHLP